MDNTEVKVVETTIDVGFKDQIVVTVLGAIAGLLASKLTEKAYFTGKARYQLRKSN
jgi:hypothetical protein